SDLQGCLGDPAVLPLGVVLVAARVVQGLGDEVFLQPVEPGPEAVLGPPCGLDVVHAASLRSARGTMACQTSGAWVWRTTCNSCQPTVLPSWASRRLATASTAP